MTTFHDAMLTARRQIEQGADPDQVVPGLLAIAEAQEEIDMAAGLYGEDEIEEQHGDG